MSFRDKWETALCRAGVGRGGKAVKGEREVRGWGEREVRESGQRKGRENSRKESKKKETGKGRERKREGRQTEKETILAILRETMVLYKQIISESQHRDSFLKTPLMYYSCICPLKQRLPTELIFS